MTLNIIDSLKSGFSDEIIGQLGKFINEDASKTQAALGAVFPALLGGLVGKASSLQGATEILNMISNNSYGAETLKRLSGAFMGGDVTDNLLKAGMGLLEGIFGNRLPSVVDWVASSSGIGKNAASSLLGLTAPTVLGVIGREVNAQSLNAAGLMKLLSGQTGFIKKLAPAGLASVLGLKSLSDIARIVSVPTPKGSPLWRVVLPLAIVVIILLFLYKTCSTPPVEEITDKVTETIPEPVTEPVPQVLAELGAFSPVKLPNGVELSVPEYGIERKLIAFIEDASKPVDETTWFTFDRLEFETGSAVLMSTSAEQMNNIAEIMRAYPQVTLKIGGYTDNTGSPQANLLLSQQRAENTMQALVRLGIEATRLAADGYGEKYPVADNTTDEGRQKNRRIDVRVTNK